MKIKHVFSLVVLYVIISTASLFAQKQMEHLNRGLMAIRTNPSEVLVSWRILGPEYANGATYNLYADGSLIASNLSVSNFKHASTSDHAYTVAAVINSVEQGISAAINVWDNFYYNIPINAPSGGTTPDGVSYSYEANDASVGDLDGDGDYEIVLKWMPTNSKDNANSGYTGNTILEGIELDGTSLWRINLGINIRSGAHYTQFMVYDLDSDGDAEIACKTADGTVDGNGTVIGSSSADYRTSSGYVLSGPEYLTVFSGSTGRALETTSYVPARGSVSDWGDNYGNRVDRFLAAIAYLDGKEPSLVMCRGYYTRTVLAAWDYRNGSLTQRWVFDTDNGHSSYAGQGNHNLAVGDLDDDGKDEIQYGSMAIDDDGSGLYTTGLGHGDASHLGDFDPNRSGLEFFMPHETANGSSIPMIDFRDPTNGQVLWKTNGSGDIGRGITADIDPNYPGAESWASDGTGIHAANGSVISTTYPTTAGNGTTYNMLAWYDGDLLRELVDRTVITKYNPSTGGTDRVLTAYSYGVTSNNSSKSNPCLVADIMGDWREEIIWRKSDNTALVMFCTPNVTSERIFTLMHDPHYRVSVAWQNVGYNQPAHTSFFLGNGMSAPAAPNISIVGETLTGNITLSASADDGVVNLDWSLNAISSSLQIFRDTDSNPSGRVRIATVGNGASTYSDTDVTNGTTYYYWIKATDNYGNTLNSNAASATPVGCTPSTITPYIQVNGGTWSASSSATLDEGGSVKFGPQPVSGGSWNWTGPNAYTATSREITLSAITTNNAGNYTAYYTNSAGCGSSHVFAITVNEVLPELTLTIQENETGFCSVDGSVDNNNSGYSGAGFANTNNASGNGISWRVNIPVSGNYQLAWRYANGGSADRTAKIMVDGSTVTSSFSMPSTGAWTTWSSTPGATIYLSAGDRILRLEATNASGLSNIDYMSISGISPTGVSCIGQKSAESLQFKNTINSEITIYPNPVHNDEIHINIQDAAASKTTVSIYSVSGKVMLQDEYQANDHSTLDVKVDISRLAAGSYFIRVIHGNKTKSLKLIRY